MSLLRKHFSNQLTVQGVTLKDSLLFPFCALIVFGVLFILSSDLQVTRYESFFGLEWEEVRGYSGKPTMAATNSPELQGARAMHSMSLSSASQKERILSSSFFPAQQAVLHISYAAGPADPDCALDLSLVDKHTLKSETFHLPAAGTAGWQEASLELPFQSDALQLQVSQAAAKHCWSAIKHRGEWYSFSALLSIQEFFRSSLIGSTLLCLFFASSIVWCLVRFLCRIPGNWAIFLFLLLLSTLCQLRLASYFYWDEWHALERFARQGIGSVLRTHNEHFLPLFFLWYSLEAWLFHGMYLPMIGISLFIHALNAFLICSLLQKFGAQKFAATLLAAVFTISTLHGESLQWAFEQSLLLSHLLLFSSLLWLLHFLEHGRTPYLALAALAGGLAPLFFGNGFVVALYAPILLIAWMFVHEKFRLFEHWKRAFLALGAVFLGLLPSVILYAVNKEGDGHGIEQARMFANLPEVFGYIFVGSQLGTFLRGVGLVPFVNLGIAPSLVSLLAEHIPQITLIKIRPELLLANVALILSFLLLLASLWICRRGLTLWIAGQALLLSSLLLPALGRWNFGLHQSLSLRYHYGSFLGVLLMLLPIVQYAFAGQTIRSTKARLGVLLLVLFAAVQCFSALDYTYFQELGVSNRRFIRSLMQWRESLPAGSSYEGHGTRFEGLHPSYPSTLTPGKHPNEIYFVLQWMQSDFSALTKTDAN